MNKIPTIFERDWNGDKKVVDKIKDGIGILAGAKATEKIDGMNVRVTIRSGQAVRLEKRRNPSGTQKAQGIENPWYVDADEYAPEDKWLYDALKNADISKLPDGEWSAEAVGKNIQGNPLNLENNRLVFFSLGQAPVFEDVPTTYNELREWLPKQRSKVGSDCPIEGIVWHWDDGSMAKVKTKDFPKNNS